MSARLSLSLPVLLLASLAAGAGQGQAVLVEIGQDKFTMTDFQLYLRQVNPHLDFGRLPPRERRYWLDDFVNKKLFALRARQAKLDQVPETQARIEFFVDGVLAQAFKDKVLQEVTVSDADLEAYYRDHPEEFRLPARVLLQHFLYKTPEKAAHAQTRLREGAAFGQLAEEKKLDADVLLAERGWFVPEALIRELAEVAFQLPAGKVSDVIRSSYGYHVLRVEASEPVRNRDLAAARAELSEKVRRAKAAPRYQQILDETRQQHQVRVHFNGSGPSD